jgi:hypothetical protein
MDISNINASTAYTANESAKPPVDSTQLKTQEATPTETDPSQTTARQQAFEVNITQEAQDLMAEESAQTSMEAPMPDKTSGDGSDQSQSTAQEARQIVNIVA